MSPGGLTGIVNAVSEFNLILRSRAEARVAPARTGWAASGRAVGYRTGTEVTGFEVAESIECADY